MNWTGKMIGMILGFFLGGPVGLLVGLFIGHIAIDQAWFRRWLQSILLSKVKNINVQGIFFDATFRVMGFLAKADGHVSENEIRQARAVMQQMGLDEAMKREAIRLFTEGKQADFNLDAVLNQLKRACLFQPALLRVFFEIQLQTARVDGLSEAKERVLQYISQQLGMIDFSFERFKEYQRTEKKEQYQYQSSQSSVGQNARLLGAYHVLGVPCTASMPDVKKAYRRLMSRHHPDKLMAKGLSVEQLKMATEKTQQIKNAYEQIRKARGVL